MPAVEVQKRDFSGPLTLPGMPKLAAGRYSNAALGGPKRAELSASGHPLALWALFDLLRCPVVIYDEFHWPAWWGYVETVSVPTAWGREERSVKEMFHRVKVTYTEQDNLLSETAWAADSGLIAEWGQKEIIRSLGKAEAAGAVYMRDTFLTNAKRPRLSRVQLGPERGQAEPTAQIICAGWWNTLGWKHVNRGDIAIAGHTQPAGTAFDHWPHNSYGWNQSFTVAQTKYASILEFYGRLRADAGGAFKCAIHSGSPVPSATVAVSDNVNVETFAEREKFFWLTFRLNSEATLSPGTTYWAGLGHGFGTGLLGVDLLVDEGLGYTGGVLRVSGHGGYFPRNPDADLYFGVYGLRDSSEVAGDVAALGEFITGYDVIGTSGNLWRTVLTQDTSILGEIREKLETGSANGRRMLADVKQDRRLRIREEPVSAPGGDYRLRADGVIEDPDGNVVPPSRCPAGVWLRIVDPLTPDPFVGGQEAFFVDEAEYDPRAGTLRLTPRGATDPWDFGAVRAIGVPRA